MYKLLCLDAVHVGHHHPAELVLALLSETAAKPRATRLDEVLRGPRVRGELLQQWPLMLEQARQNDRAIALVESRDDAILVNAQNGVEDPVHEVFMHRVAFAGL